MVYTPLTLTLHFYGLGHAISILHVEGDQSNKCVPRLHNGHSQINGKLRYYLGDTLYLSMCLQVLLRWFKMVEFADIKVAINNHYLISMMTTPDIQRYLVKSVSLKYSSSCQRCSQYQGVSLRYCPFEDALVQIPRRITSKIKTFLWSQLFHPTMFK